MRPYQKLSERFINKKQKIIGALVRKPNDTQKFNDNLNTLLQNITNYLTHHGGKPEDITNKTDQSRRLWTENLSKIHGQYYNLFNAYERLVDEEKIINRIETRAHLRALLFRFLTTLAIGAGVMLVYFLSHKWGIPMPLSRTLINGL